MFTLKISTANEAFEHEHGEVSRILRELADKLSTASGRRDTVETGTLRDSNGNTVGKWELR